MKVGLWAVWTVGRLVVRSVAMTGETSVASKAVSWAPTTDVSWAGTWAVLRADHLDDEKVEMKVSSSDAP